MQHTGTSSRDLRTPDGFLGKLRATREAAHEVRITLDRDGGAGMVREEVDYLLLLVNNAERVERLVEAVEGMKRPRHSESQYWKAQCFLALDALDKE